MVVVMDSHNVQTLMQQKGLSAAEWANKIKAFVTLAAEKRDDVVKISIETAIKICEEQEITL